MLEADVTITIYKEAVMGHPPTVTTPEALEFRKEVDASILKRREWAKQNNVKFEFQIPYE
jgi:hypothetical protein